MFRVIRKKSFCLFKVVKTKPIMKLEISGILLNIATVYLTKSLLYIKGRLHKHILNLLSKNPERREYEMYS